MRFNPRWTTKLGGAGEAGEVPSGGHDGDDDGGVDTGNGHQPGHERGLDCFDGDVPVELSEFCTVEVELAQQRVDAATLIGRHVLFDHPKRPTPENMSACDQVGTRLRAWIPWT